MSDSKVSSAPKLSRRATALVGLVVVFIIALLVNVLVGKISFRTDLTEYKSYTLSEGTANILGRLETPVNIRYYVTDDSKVMSPGERSSARRVEDLLAEFVRAAPTKEIEVTNDAGEFEKKKVKMLTVKKLNPEPNTDAEDSALIDGLQAGVSGETNNELYFGIAIQCLDSVEAIPFIPARPETSLEYDLARAVSSVHGGKTKKIAVMSSLPIGGGFGGNFQAPPQQPWMFYELLGKDYEVEVIPPTATEIPAGTSTLIVVHPFDITDEGQFAIDQYVLQGGNVMVFVDPNFFYARALAQGQPQMPGMPPQGGPEPSSTLDKLFKAWGVNFDENRVLADLDFGSEIVRRGNFSPTFLTLNRSALGSENTDPGLTDPMTNMLNQLNMLTPGAFEVAPAAGITVDALVLSSVNNQLVGSFDADPTQEGGADRIREKFEAFGKRRPLVVRLSGEFKTAFPEGDPAVKAEENAKKGAPDEKKADEKTPDGATAKDAVAKTDDTSLKAATAPGRVLLIADVDFIYDAAVVRRQQIPGLNIVIPEMLNENLTLVQNAAEQMSGDPDLINVRSRTSVRRPFTKQSEWYREAQQKYAAEVADFSGKAKEAEQKLNELLAKTPEKMDQAMLSPEVQKELKNLQEEEVNFRRRERELQKEVTREFRRKLATYKFGNTLIMPILVILAGILLAIFRRRRTAAR
ncbi:MAG: Gldg family protein [Verrucomicrobiales bacterium]|jgi:ABC-type uncharacterized transport system involved in gliding motility auxiliary subunit|nr:Gldg family protein [Verrucomicrobiales bacterium]